MDAGGPEDGIKSGLLHESTAEPAEPPDRMGNIRRRRRRINGICGSTAGIIPDGRHVGGSQPG